MPDKSITGFDPKRAFEQKTYSSFRKPSHDESRFEREAAATSVLRRFHELASDLSGRVRIGMDIHIVQAAYEVGDLCVGQHG